MVILSLGSNLGDRAFMLAQARAMLASRLGALSLYKKDVLLLCSPVIETAPEGFASADTPRFLNQTVTFSRQGICLSPSSLLQLCKLIEVQLGRPWHTAEFDASGARVYRSRTIDIDILQYDSVVMNTPELTLPYKAHFDISLR